MSYLGKRFKTVIDASLDQGMINRNLRKFEDLKLQILDAVEAGEGPPIFHDMNWAYKLNCMSGPYACIWNSFAIWLGHNGLSYLFQNNEGNMTMAISVYFHKDYSQVEELSTVNWLDKVRSM